MHIRSPRDLLNVKISVWFILARLMMFVENHCGVVLIVAEFGKRGFYPPYQISILCTD